jgi:hypothetical protein
MGKRSLTQVVVDLRGSGSKAGADVAALESELGLEPNAGSSGVDDEASPAEGIAMLRLGCVVLTSRAFVSKRPAHFQLCDDCLLQWEWGAAPSHNPAARHKVKVLDADSEPGGRIKLRCSRAKAFSAADESPKVRRGSSVAGGLSQEMLTLHCAEGDGSAPLWVAGLQALLSAARRGEGGLEELRGLMAAVSPVAGAVGR